MCPLYFVVCSMQGCVQSVFNKSESTLKLHIFVLKIGLTLLSEHLVLQAIMRVCFSAYMIVCAK